MGGPKEQLRQQESRPLDNSSKARLGMGSRAAQHFHRRNPSQHRVLASIIDDMNKDAGINKIVQLKSGGGRGTHVPVNIEARIPELALLAPDADRGGGASPSTGPATT